MNLDIDAGAALVTAGLVAHEIEGAGDAGSSVKDEHHACANCGTVLTGAFCHGCGQKAHVHRSVLHLGEEFLHGLLHFDTKAWRTLPLLAFRPGQLTRRYLDGQRARFVSPLALFLFMMFLMFFVGSLTSGQHLVEPDAGGDGVAKLQDKVVKGRAAVVAAEAALKAAPAGADQADLAETLADAREELAGLEKAQAIVKGSVGEAITTAVKAKEGSGLKPGFSSDFKTDIPAVDAALAKANSNPELALYKLKNAATKYTFLLVPISMPFVWLMFFWKRGVTMYDHAVFVLYSLSFMALMFIVAFLLKYTGLKAAVAGLVLLAPPVHMFAQLRGTYLLGVGGALWRTVALLFTATIVFMLYLVVVLVLAVK